MLRASNRVQQQQQQQQGGGFGASSIIGVNRSSQSQQFRPPSAMMSRPAQIFQSSPPVHQQISIQVSESGAFADESQVLGEGRSAVGIEEGSS